MRLIERVWFQGDKAKWWLVPLLAPLSLIFWLLSSLRRLLFNVRIFARVNVGVPVIVVGNIGVGGNGKTPLVIHLIEQCKALGLSPGVISRGYGGKLSQGQTYPLLLNQYTPVEQTGDEPFLLYHRCNVPVVVGPDRVASAQLLKAQGCNIILTDDGLQHYRLQRDYEIIVVDGKRGLGNGLLLPAGPLREGRWRLKTADCVVVNGNNRVNIAPPFIQMTLLPTQVVNIVSGKRVDVADFVQHHRHINAVAGIGDPQRFFDTLTSSGFHVNSQQGFVDHHPFSSTDLRALGNKLPLLMTEKDAVKCKAFAEQHCWYLAVSAQIGEQETQQLSRMLFNTESQ